MSLIRLFRLVILVCCVYAAAGIVGGHALFASSATPAVVEAGKPGEDSVNIFSNSNIPLDLSEIMRASRAKYFEGSDLIKAGDSEKAREAFDDAVD